jgi:hypothetical protein
MDASIEINQPQSLEYPDEKQKDLDPRLQSPPPEDADTGEHQQPFDRRHDPGVVLGIPIGNGAVKAVIAQGQKVPVGIVGMDRKVLQGMKEHTEGKIEAVLKFDQEADQDHRQGQGH